MATLPSLRVPETLTVTLYFLDAADQSNSLTVVVGRGVVYEISCIVLTVGLVTA